MARNPVVFQNGTLVSNAKVEVDGVIYDVVPAEYEGTTPLSANNLNQLQTNLYNYVDEEKLDIYSSNETLTNKVWMNKPVYRKVFDFDVSPDSGNDYIIDISNYDFIWINTGNSFIKTSTRSYPIVRADYRNMNYQIGCILDTVNNKLFTLIGPNVFIGTGHAYIVFEYTKAT